MNSRYVKAIITGVVSLFISAPVFAQDRNRRDDQQINRKYQDRAHNDSHEWNDQSNQEYRRYLEEHHRKYHDFARANTREQNDFWNWFHSHSGNDRR